MLSLNTTQVQLETEMVNRNFQLEVSNYNRDIYELKTNDVNFIDIIATMDSYKDYLEDMTEGELLKELREATIQKDGSYIHRFFVKEVKEYLAAVKSC